MSNTLKITADQKLCEIQKQFNELFPYLKFEFLKISNKIFNSNSTQVISNLDLQLGQFKTDTAKSTIDLHENMQVIALEQAFVDTFRIQAKVLRRFGKSWLGTTLTHDWTLKYQNSKGQEISKYQ